jgi:hypothetical protein
MGNGTAQLQAAVDNGRNKVSAHSMFTECSLKAAVDNGHDKVSLH